MARAAALAAERVVSTGTPWEMATWRNMCSSLNERLPRGVLMTRWMSPLMMWSTPLGRPSLTFRIVLTLRPAARRTAAVPRVAMRENPKSASSRAMGSRFCLSRSLTLRNTVPDVGRALPAAICALA